MGSVIWYSPHARPAPKARQLVLDVVISTAIDGSPPLDSNYPLFVAVLPIGIADDSNDDAAPAIAMARPFPYDTPSFFADSVLLCGATM